jgi:hypothetical protein
MEEIDQIKHWLSEISDADLEQEDNRRVAANTPVSILGLSRPRLSLDWLGRVDHVGNA